MLACQHQDPGDFDGHAFGGFDQRASSAARAILVDAPFEAWSDPLSRHLDQTERAGSEDFGSGTIAFHRVAQGFFNFATMRFFAHIDKVVDDYASQIPQSQLSCDLLAGR
jgi:hypothetical protein